MSCIKNESIHKELNCRTACNSFREREQTHRQFSRFFLCTSCYVIKGEIPHCFQMILCIQSEECRRTGSMKWTPPAERGHLYSYYYSLFFSVHARLKIQNPLKVITYFFNFITRGTQVSQQIWTADFLMFSVYCFYPTMCVQLLIDSFFNCFPPKKSA